MIKSYKQFENIDDPYGEEVWNGEPEENIRNLEELLSSLDKKGYLDGYDLFPEELEIIEANIVEINYMGINLSEHCSLCQLGDFIVNVDLGDDYGQGYYITKIGRMEQ